HSANVLLVFQLVVLERPSPLYLPLPYTTLFRSCLACSTETVPKTVYDEIIADISKFLHGGYKEIKQDLKEKMNIASEQLNFERAKELRDQIASIEAVMERQKVTLNEKTDI